MRNAKHLTLTLAAGLLLGASAACEEDRGVDSYPVRQDTQPEQVPAEAVNDPVDQPGESSELDTRRTIQSRLTALEQRWLELKAEQAKMTDAARALEEKLARVRVELRAYDDASPLTDALAADLDETLDEVEETLEGFADSA